MIQLKWCVSTKIKCLFFISKYWFIMNSLSKLKKLQEKFNTFSKFAKYIYKVNYGFTPYKCHYEVMSLLDNTNDNIILLAFRGFSKTTITQMYALYKIIHNPNIRIIYTSKDTAFSISLVNTLRAFIRKHTLLNVLEPKSQDVNTDKLFYINSDLRTMVDKSPTVISLSINQAGEGNRGDLIIADDVETYKNTKTVRQRQELKDNVFELTNIADRGRLIVLGTPRYKDSLYFELGNNPLFNLYMIPARYPTENEGVNEQYLIPYLKKIYKKDRKKLNTGYGMTNLLGKSIEPKFVSEAFLQKKEIFDMSNYLLAYHLYYKISELDIINTRNILVCGNDYNVCPKYFVLGTSYNSFDTYTFRTVAGISDTYEEYNHKFAWIDPAGTGKDETSLIVVGTYEQRVYLLGVYGNVNPPDDTIIKEMADLANEMEVDSVYVENNMNSVIINLLKPHCNMEVIGIHSKQNKAEKINNFLRHIITSNRLIFTENAILQDISMAGDDLSYSLCYQINNFIFDTSYVKHNIVDRIDGLASLLKVITENNLMLKTPEKLNKAVTKHQDMLDNHEAFMTGRVSRNLELQYGGVLVDEY